MTLFNNERRKKFTSASGLPYYNNEGYAKRWLKGPLLLQDFNLHEKMAHFNRELIPEKEWCTLKEAALSIADRL
jgi:catalase